LVKQLEPSISPAYTAWENTINKVIDHRLYAQGVQH
jgi:hypothetical protein